MQRKENFHIVYLGETGFPVGFGAIQRLIMVSQSLIDAGAKVTVINRKGHFNPDKSVPFKKEGVFEGINYVYTSGTVYKSKSFLKRNWQKIVGKYNEFRYLAALKRNNDLHAGIISCYSFTHVLLYRLYGWLFNFPIVLNYVEWAAAIQHRVGWKKRINDYLYEKWLVPSMDGALPISEVLMNNFQKVSDNKPSFKIPILCDFEKFDRPAQTPERPYFCYCGALDYKEVIDFLLEAYNGLPKSSEAGLHLILGGGSQSNYDQLMKDIAKLKRADWVKVFRNVPHHEIPDHYAPALALLIPLRPTLQDAARFPHKIGEYVASGNPMISSNFGEVAYYFKDGDNGLITEGYEVEQFTQKMKFVLDNPKVAQKIGLNGKKTGLKAFNYKSYGQTLRSFLEGLYTVKNPHFQPHTKSTLEKNY